MPASNSNPRAAMITQASAIWATVLSLETRSGLSAMGLSTSHDKITALTIMMSRETTRMTSQPGMASAMPSATQIETSMALSARGSGWGRGPPADRVGENPVAGRADAGGEEQADGAPPRARRDRPDHDRHQQDAAERNEVRNAQVCAPARPARLAVTIGRRTYGHA